MADTTAPDREKVKAFAAQILSDIGIAVQGALTYIGDKLGIFKAMAAAHAPITIEELASTTGLNARYLREWLGAMTAARYVDYDSANDTYFLPPEHAAILADDDNPYFLGGFIQESVPLASMAPKVAEAFRSGKGVSQGEYPPDMFAAIERSSAGIFKNQLIRRWMPAMPDVEEKLRAGGSALDVGCGSGRASIAIAQAFPAARVFGFDSHEGSIERARANAKAAGLGDRIRFEVADCAKLPGHEFDFISTFDVIHDSVDPSGLMSSIRSALATGGTYLMVEMNVSANVAENINPLGRLMYSASTLYCLTTSMAEGGAAIGAMMGESKARDLATATGFGSFRRLPVKDPFSALYELKA
ncbi:MAG TPA: class I SAM-dependent methyltransferase [Candidatus Binataceae bacterium]|nr:class I SAM-dependent methyltransferase [Candidatus Binataceae bacterium]